MYVLTWVGPTQRSLTFDISAVKTGLTRNDVKKLDRFPCQPLWNALGKGSQSRGSGSVKGGNLNVF